VQGVCEEVAAAFERSHGVRVDAAAQITLTCGQSEAMAATMLSGISSPQPYPSVKIALVEATSLR